MNFAEMLRESTRACVNAAIASTVEKSLLKTIGMDEMTHAVPWLLVGGVKGDTVGVAVGVTEGKLCFLVSITGAEVKNVFRVLTEGAAVMIIGALVGCEEGLADGCPDGFAVGWPVG